MSRKGNRLRANQVKNFLPYNVTKDGVGSASNLGKRMANPEAVSRDLRNYITPVQLQRLRTDISMWRDAVGEAERAYYPFRVKMQRIYIDTILNGHVFSLMERRKDMTLLRKFCFCDAKGEPIDELTQHFQNLSWFSDFVAYSLDALFFGYSVISLGDLENDEMKDVSIIPRWFFNPDRCEVGSYIYATSGKDVNEPPQSDWHVYVKTKSDNGVSPCGYGLFYNIALYEIFLRNTLGFNGDFVELYAMPYRVGKTTKTNEAERAELESALRNMGSAGYAVIDPMDEITFLETSLAGTGYKAYESLEKRCEDKVARIILGHSDAANSTPGKLGGDQGGEESPAQIAMKDKQIKDGRFIEQIINGQLLPKLRRIGYKLPENITFKYLNDGEEEAIREKEDTSNKVTAEIAQTLKNAGMKMDPAYFTKRTGIPVSEIEEVEPIEPGAGKEEDEDDLRQKVQVKNKLKELYNRV